MKQHLFLFQPGLWLGQGTIQIDQVAESMPFYTRWNVQPVDEIQIIQARQEIEIQGSEQKLVNQLCFSNIMAKHFSVVLTSEYLTGLEGEGLVDAHTIAWEFHSPKQALQGVEVYHLQQDGSYLCQAEFCLSASLRTKISYKLWQSASAS